MLRRLRRRSKKTVRLSATDGTTDSGATDPSGGAPADLTQEEVDPPPAAISAEASSSSAQLGDSDSINGVPMDEEPNIHQDTGTVASAATAEEAEEEEEVVQGAETVADGDIYGKDRRSIEENEDIVMEDAEEVVDPLQGSAISDRDQTSNGDRLRRTKRSPKPIERYEGGLASAKKSKNTKELQAQSDSAMASGMPRGACSTDSAEASVPFSTDAEWIAASSNNTIRVCRIKIFCNKSKTAFDKYGRLSSLWCIDKGYIASANRVIPEDLLSDPIKALKYLRQETEEKVKERCLLSPLFPKGKTVRHLTAYITFAKLKPGDIIILQLKGEKNKDPGVAIFGVVEDDSFLIKSKDEVFGDKSIAFPSGFPWVLNHGENHDPYANGLMLRKIKWMRHGVIRQLPMQKVTKKGADMVTWMHESGPSFCVEVTNEDNGGLKDDALSAMRSQEFLERTECLDQAWILSETAKWQAK